MANFTAPADSFFSSASTEHLVTVMKEKTKDPIIFPTVQGLQAINIILRRKKEHPVCQKWQTGVL